VKRAGERIEGKQVELVVGDDGEAAGMGAYEELLLDAIQGNAARFARQDYVEQAWRIVDHVLGDATPVHEYAPGTWGPPQAAALVAAPGEWLDPAPADGP
jgi:glucose-6-phosphate 1-dehydrogenase